MNRRDTIIRAILDLHYERAVETLPTGIEIDAASLREHTETYRPYAEQEADAILAALFGQESVTQTRRYFSDAEWGRIPPKLKDRWWNETDYGKLVPSAELVGAVQEAVGPGAGNAS